MKNQKKNSIPLWIQCHIGFQSFDDLFYEDHTVIVISLQFRLNQTEAHALTKQIN